MTRTKKGDTVSVHYKSKLEDGTVFDSSEKYGPLQFTIGKAIVVPGFEEAVEGMKPGESKTVIVPPEKGYGSRQEVLVVEIERDKLPEGLEPEVGQMVEFSKDGHRFEVSVVAVEGSMVTLDANHPLAGKNVVFEITLEAIL